MPINACSINAYTINALRCRRPNIVPPVVTPVVGTNNSSVSTQFAKQYPHLVRHAEEPVEQLQYELDDVSVQAELLDARGSMMVNMAARVDFATVSDFKLGPGIKSDPPEDLIRVNIVDLSI